MQRYYRILGEERLSTGREALAVFYKMLTRSRQQITANYKSWQYALW
jgi:hypothetical protein